ncbi:zf-HC2 domain-containing protein [Actinoalloteichus hymeniacidonis]|uniref:Integral membrane protein n=1 Tax=Actinoalloteichus hymeniacidonis TaxID=340345 RepID=A0AAC9HT20_9PSEU|nr:zf-HC2 domain-containing protein [Actinoalloteichus hymeniacidonis]AOS64840.1 putative integral membrane protein [Actinoalloteichus hymeniacidonis]MBB5907085.1 putative anti-sigma-YlaC factor YlaD [Actinoalloteichus hymeniacidonis]
MDCERYREALSARIDGEASVLPESEINRHVQGCSECHAWEGAVTDMRRSMHVRSAPAVPDLTDRIMAMPAPAKPRRQRRRILLGIVAVTQILLGVGQLLGGGHHVHGASGGLTAGHLINESAAWNLALGVGLLWAAVRTRAAAGQLPMLGGFAVVLGLVSIGDLVGGLVTAERVLSHSLVFIGVILLMTVARGHREEGLPGPATTGNSGSAESPVITPNALALITGAKNPPGAQARAQSRSDLDRAA